MGALLCAPTAFNRAGLPPYPAGTALTGPKKRPPRQGVFRRAANWLAAQKSLAQSRAKTPLVTRL